MKRETFRKQDSAGLEVIQVPNKTIVLPFDEEIYAEFITANAPIKPTFKPGLTRTLSCFQRQ